MNSRPLLDRLRSDCVLRPLLAALLAWVMILAFAAALFMPHGAFAVLLQTLKGGSVVCVVVIIGVAVALVGSGTIFLIGLADGRGEAASRRVQCGDWRFTVSADGLEREIVPADGERLAMSSGTGLATYGSSGIGRVTLESFISGFSTETRRAAGAGMSRRIEFRGWGES
jgi:hypothetical protein